MKIVAPRRTPHWPVTLKASTPAGRLELRPLRSADEHRYLALRVANAEWLAPWDATTPEHPQVHPSSAGFRDMARTLNRGARAGTHLPWLLWFAAGTEQPQMIGQLTAGPITAGSSRSAPLGYWVDQGHAGRGLSAVAVALAADHLFLRTGLHRVEINIRPENAPSLRIVEKLGFRDEGVRERFLHIDGAWRDHRSFALTREEIGAGLLARCPGSQSGIG